ncbi:hypothetical protein Leryth_001062 [Lithospermum erythrorhizon]|nr:hypothetical protein Leryth_001062 [Lithospermum erythrorhizon]
MASSSINGNNHQASKFGIQHHFHEQQHPHQQQHHQNNQISFDMMQASNSSSNIIPGNYIGRDAGTMDLVDVDSPFYLYQQLENQEPPQLNDHRQNNSSMTPHTLNIFPSQPMHAVAEPLPQSVVSKITNGAGSSSSTEPSMELSNKGNNNNGVAYAAEQPNKTPKSEGKGKAPMTSDGEHGVVKDPKTLRRLAQNREAARKSRLRKKAYVQQLESSRIRLSQLEQEIQRARAQGFMIGGNNGLLGGDPSVLALNNNLSGSAFFDNEYVKWLEDHTRLMHELRAAVEEHLPEHDLRGYVDNCLVHFEQFSNLKDLLSKVDVLHLITGTWTTPAERHLMWIGGFRPSYILKQVILNHIEPLTESQLLNIYGLQTSTEQTEDKMNSAFEMHRRILIDTIAAGSLHPPNNANEYNNQLFSAMSKIANIEPLARQA